jgi:CHAT domain-containing protein
LELRIPDAGYTAVAPRTHTRGMEGDKESPPLLEARAGLSRQLQQSPKDPKLLQLQARADVLDERYDAAIDVLDRLISIGPATAELLTDAAAAYYQRGLAANRELDRSMALDYLRRADELAPDNPVVLFNEAIVMEDRGQMMNAVEVWNRYVTVERDAKWAAEGRRKLTALEQTLNRLKSHESRIQQMLATPEAMDALAADKARLAVFDEELSSIEIDKLLIIAYPVAQPMAGGVEQARGSPCAQLCQAAHRLLQATATSLELQHHDYWLKDILSVPFDSIPVKTQIQYAQAMHMLGQATREDQTGRSEEGARLSFASRRLFLQLKEESALHTVAGVGEKRAAVEYLFALQRGADFNGCRSFAQQQGASMGLGERTPRYPPRYPWIDSVWLITEKVCDDTPETRAAGRRLLLPAEQLAQAARYPLLDARIKMRFAGSAQNSGDSETYERLCLNIFRSLTKGDPPAFRILNTIAGVPFSEVDSLRAHTAELSLREDIAWAHIADFPTLEADLHMQLASAEMRIGARREAENQIRIALPGIVNGILSETNLARSMLELGDLANAAHFLKQASALLSSTSDSWLLLRYWATVGQLQLSQKNYEAAAQMLESAIRTSEGRNVRGGDRATAAEYAEQDQDLYAELAATWLAQGRPPTAVLALWERFRLRSRGLPILACPGHALDCEQSSLKLAQRKLGNSLLFGQIILLDRVLVYRLDNQHVTWNEKPVHRRDMLDAAQILEQAVHSPLTSSATAEQLGAHLSDTLLPRLPASLGPDGTLLLEPDPMLQNLPWPVLPATTGPLGLEYPLAELPSILDPSKNAVEPRQTAFGRALIVGASIAEDEPPLPEALTEAQAVDGFLHAPTLLLGGQATAVRVAQALSTATIFHFAGHAIQTNDGTELLLAAASPADSKPWMDGDFLRRHPPRACKLAVLSACATGEREASWNHPRQDIVETLSSLGVPEIVATRWQIDSETAVPFIDTLYQNLQQGESVAQALTAARRVQSHHSLTRNPYYWGAYYVTGRENTRFTGVLYASRESQGEAHQF